MTSPKPMMDLPMDTKNHSCSCGGPAEFVEAQCPTCGEKGARVKVGTVRYHLHTELRADATDKIYGLCLSPDCNVAWYAQDGSHHFTTSQTDTPIWAKADAAPVMACYCNEITKEMVADAVSKKGLRGMEEIILHYRDEMKSMCAVKNPMGRCCTDAFEAMLAEALKDYLACNC